MSEMIERVARAMSAACYEETGSHQFITSVWEHFAREGIGAMREPSAWSVEQARRYAVAAGFDIPAEIVRNMLRAAIDGALSQSGG